MNKRLIILCAGLLMLVMLTSLYILPAAPVDAAPAAAITPVTYSGQSSQSTKVTFFNGNIAADTRVCADLSNYSKVDLQWIIDQGTVNTTTIKLQWSNDNVNFEDSATVASANVADTHSGQQYVLAGQYNCIYADVTNSNALGLKILGVAK